MTLGPIQRMWVGVLALAAATALAGCARRETPERETAAVAPDSIPDAYAQPTAALIWPGATRAFQVLPSGDLYNGEWRVVITPGTESDSAGPPRVIAYQERRLPVVRWTRRSPGLRWEFEALAIPEPAPRDSGLIVALEIRAFNEDAAPRTARLRLGLEPPGPDPVFTAFDAPERPSPPLAWNRSDTAYAWTAGGGREAVTSFEASIRPGESGIWRALLPAYPTLSRRLLDLARRPHSAWRRDVVRAWRSQLEAGTRFALGDPEVERALDAARVLLLASWERRGTSRVPIGGPFHYRDVWLRDGARQIHALSVSGHTQLARELAVGLTALQWPQGAFLSQRGQPDGTGQALWAFEQAFLRPTPDDSLRRLVDAASRAWKWFEWQRDFGRQSGWRLGTLLPYADPRDNELVRAQLVGTDAWALAGYRSTARLMRAAGRSAEAEQVERTYTAYRSDFENALRTSGSSDVPPSWQGVGRDWGNLTVGWPCAVLEAGDPRLARLARRVWATAGGAGLATYASRDSLHYYVGADLGTWALLAGYRAQADSVLEALLHWRNASGAAGEIFSPSGDFGRNLPPHPTSAAALIALVRNSLLFDDRDTLQLTLGARALWWRGARIERAPTRWGNLNLEFGRQGAEAHWRWTAVPVWTALTLPPGTRLAAPPPSPLVAAGTTALLAPPGTGEARVRVSDGGP